MAISEVIFKYFKREFREKCVKIASLPNFLDNASDIFSTVALRTLNKIVKKITITYAG